MSHQGAHGGSTRRIVLSCDGERYQDRKPCQERLSQVTEVQTLHSAIITSLHVGCPPRGRDLRHSQLLSTRATSEEAWLSPRKGLAEILFRITHPSCFMQMYLTNTEGFPSLSFPSSLLILQCEQPGTTAVWRAQWREESTQVGPMRPVGCAWTGAALIGIYNARPCFWLLSEPCFPNWYQTEPCHGHSGF